MQRLMTHNRSATPRPQFISNAVGAGLFEIHLANSNDTLESEIVEVRSGTRDAKVKTYERNLRRELICEELSSDGAG